jgi:hypothetical protein
VIQIEIATALLFMLCSLSSALASRLAKALTDHTARSRTPALEMRNRRRGLATTRTICEEDGREQRVVIYSTLLFCVCCSV